MKKLTYLLLVLFTFSVALPSLTHAETTSSQKSSEVKKDEGDKPVGAKAGQKGGIYTVGRAFKKAGKSMESGFKSAGRGIKKGGKAMGRGFKKAGRSIHDFFTGEKSDKKD